MAQKYLGDYFDIHCGGEDHIPGPSHQRDRADRGARRHAAREFLDARLFPAAERREDGEVGRRVPAHRGAGRARLRSARVSLPVPDRRTIGRSSISRGMRSTPRRRASPGCARGFHALRGHAPTRWPTPDLLARFTDARQRRSQHAARAGGRVGRAARRSARRRQARDACRASTRCSASELAAWQPPQEDVPPESRARWRKRAPTRARHGTGPRPTACAPNCTRPAGRWRTGPTVIRVKRRSVARLAQYIRSIAPE